MKTFARLSAAQSHDMQAVPPARRGRDRNPPHHCVALAAALVLGACTHGPSDPQARAEYQRNNDPAEPTNRVIFGGNQYLDRHLIRPVARSYTANVPRSVKGSIHNFTSNLDQPSIFVNDLLQGNVSRAWNTTQRFAINTTVGGLGLFDVATDWDRPGHGADFGETLGVWGVGPGPAVQLPLLGPSNVRDTIGKIAGSLTNPTTFISGGVYPIVKGVSGGLGAVDGRARLLPTTDTLERNSLDYYAALRSAAAQHRAAVIKEGEAGRVREAVGEIPSRTGLPPSSDVASD